MRTGRRPARTRASIAAALTLPLTVVGPAGSTVPASAGVDIRIVGGDSTASVVCGNVAAAEDIARKRGVPRQRNDCAASSLGGHVSLTDVDIFISTAARKASPDNEALASMASGSALPRTAQDRCKKVRGAESTSSRAVQRNRCWAKGVGGIAHVAGQVVGVLHHPDGSTTRRTLSADGLPTTNGTATAACTNVVAKLEEQRDNCTSTGHGASLELVGVDVVKHKPDGSRVRHDDVSLTVRGGKAKAVIECFNVVNGQGKVVQVNVCKAAATGGNITLRNVTVHTEA